MKTTLPLLVLFFAVLVGGYIYSTHQSNSLPAAASYSAGTTTDATVAAATSTQTPGTGTSGAGTTQTGTGSASSYTLAQVATHNNSKSCWAAINGNVYDLTSWISQHPGGEGRILSICGKDGTQAFGGQHGSDPRAQAMLATFKIGALAS
jgi:cytochrome b involved in lipid metabolism